ncbi:S-adenosylmethionine synthetase [Bremerella volcania]|uniref:S-adenosylmethionine synthetase n=1 Tax=Bremerella volcania TaxID=2527984 RepID=A0A518C5V5_9BACT|nr:methionine adenosyltransferase [Bremerella volcania]QDU74615.1 S-adenosylmethionine synthetase [Bremerella volcania]
MDATQIAATSQTPMSRQAAEYVERKGIGHPDTVCDSVMESIAVALSGAYLETAGRVLHFNVDKGLLVAGQTEPKFGGGKVLAPMRLFVGDRATDTFEGKKLPVGDIVEAAAEHWLQTHLRHVKPDVHLDIQNELRPGSAELVGIFDRDKITANDTSVGVGFAPLSETEHLVLSAEHFLNSKSFKHDFPETGEDVKVMGARYGRKLHLTVAIAFIDQFIWEEETYLHRKAAVKESLLSYLRSKLHDLDAVEVVVNALDDPSRGQDGLYLTVLGTSAESGDGGQVGRGNRVNGLISLSRPMTLEAAAGKNPVSHVGKIYNLLAHQTADRIYHSSDAIEEVYVWLCSRIGQPLDNPWSTSIQLALSAGATLGDVQHEVNDIVNQELSGISQFTKRLTQGELSVC